MKTKIRQQLDAEKRKIKRRLGNTLGGMGPKIIGPEFSCSPAVFEMAERTQAIPCGGIGVVHEMVNRIGLVERLNAALDVL